MREESTRFEKKLERHASAKLAISSSSPVKDLPARAVTVKTRRAAKESSKDEVAGKVAAAAVEEAAPLLRGKGVARMRARFGYT